MSEELQGLTAEEVYKQQQQLVKETFMQEADKVAESLGVSQEEATLAIYNTCGMTPWECALYVWKKKGTTIDEKTGVSGLRSLAESVLQQENVVKFKDWVRKRALELNTLNLQEYDWNKKTSATELQFLIATAKENLRKKNGELNTVISNTILGAVKELNALYRLTGANFTADDIKAVIFLGEEDLPD